MNEYIIPIGIDGNNLQKGLKETIGVLEQVEAKSPFNLVQGLRNNSTTK